MRDGLLVAQIDLNLCRQIKDKWGFRVRKHGFNKDEGEKCIKKRLWTFLDDSEVGFVRGIPCRSCEARLPAQDYQGSILKENEQKIYDAMI